MGGLDSYDPVVVWVKQQDSYVRNVGNVILRIQSGYHFGENFRGIAEGKGEIIDSNWNNIMKLKPTIIEINHSPNPVNDFLKAVELFPQEEALQFFEKVKVLSVNSSSVSSDELIQVLQKLTLLQGFSCKESNFTDEEWEKIAVELRRLNLRSLISSNNIFNGLIHNLDVELLVIPAGVTVSTIKNSRSDFVTVTHLFTEGVETETEQDAEDFLSILPEKFSRVKVFVFDWALVDTYTLFDRRTEAIIEKLIETYRTMNLEFFAITFYSPCADTRNAVQKITETLEKEIPNVQLLKYSTKGLSNRDEPNLSIITAGYSQHKFDLVKRAYVDSMTSLPDLSRILPLITNDDVPTHELTVLDFGGLNQKSIRKQFEHKQKERAEEN